MDISIKKVIIEKFKKKEGRKPYQSLIRAFKKEIDELLEMKFKSPEIRYCIEEASGLKLDEDSFRVALGRYKKSLVGQKPSAQKTNTTQENHEKAQDQLRKEDQEEEFNFDIKAETADDDIDNFFKTIKKPRKEKNEESEELELTPANYNPTKESRKRARDLWK